MKNKLIMFWVIMAIVIASIVAIVVKPTKLGLDLIGGSRLVLVGKRAGETRDRERQLLFRGRG